MASKNHTDVPAMTLSSTTVFNAAAVLVASIALPFLWQIIRYRFFHPLSKFPGPFWGSVTRLWIAWHDIKQDENEVILELHKKHGPVLRVTPTLLVVQDSTKLPEIYHRSADKSKHYIMGAFGKIESVFNMQSWKIHAHHRKLIAGPYSFTNVKQMEPLLDTRINHWVRKMDEMFCKTGKSFDFAPWAVYMAFDFISEIGFGAPFGFVDNGSDIGGLIKGFHEGLPAFGFLARLHPFTSWLKDTWIGEKYLVAKPEDESGIGTMMRFRDKLIEQRLKEIEDGAQGERVDLLQTFFNARTDDNKPLSLDYIKAETLLVLLAGADTTGTALESMITNILSRPSVYKALMSEIDAASSAGKISRLATFQEVSEHLPYYIAIIKESMRLTPSVPNLFPRLVSKGGMVLDGMVVPEGTEVSCNPWVLHREKKYYGEDAEVFRPERWLEAGRTGGTKDLEKFNMTFGYGARSCLGKDIAYMELFKAPLQFLRTFDAEFAAEDGRGKFVVSGGVGYWKDIQLRIRPRAVAP